MMKNVSTTVKKPLDLSDSLYDLRKAKGALSAPSMVTQLHNHDNTPAVSVSCLSSR